MSLPLQAHSNTMLAASVKATTTNISTAPNRLSMGSSTKGATAALILLSVHAMDTRVDLRRVGDRSATNTFVIDV